MYKLSPGHQVAVSIIGPNESKYMQSHCWSMGHSRHCPHHIIIADFADWQSTSWRVKETNSKFSLAECFGNFWGLPYLTSYPPIGSLTWLTWPNHPYAAPAIGKLCHRLETCELEVCIQKTQVVVILNACGDPSANLSRFGMETDMWIESYLYPFCTLRNPNHAKISSCIATALCFLTFGSTKQKYQNAGQMVEREKSTQKTRIQKQQPENVINHNKRKRRNESWMFHPCELQLCAWERGLNLSLDAEVKHQTSKGWHLGDIWDQGWCFGKIRFICCSCGYLTMLIHLRHLEGGSR